MERPLIDATDPERAMRPRDRRYDLPDLGEKLDPKLNPMHYINQHAGRRYWECTLGNYQVSSPDQEKAKQVCLEYARNFPEHVRDGTGLILIGPKGTGKDHLLYGTMRQIAESYRPQPGRLVYRDGLSLFAEFRATIDRKSDKNEEQIIAFYRECHLFGISDPLPPKGTLSEYEQRMWIRVIDGRYRDLRATAATINVSSRAELDERMGAQAADRLCDNAFVVMCNWESFRRPTK